MDGSGGGLIIGDNCAIGACVSISTHNSTNNIIHKGKTEYAPVKIGSNVIIHPNSVITMGCIIGDRVVIGANSFVNKDI